MKRFFSVASRLVLKLGAQFSLGGGIYYLIELVFRRIVGHRAVTWHSFVLGGGAFVIGLLLCRIPFSRKQQIIFLPILGSLAITAFEYCFGRYFYLTQNILLWDYHGYPFQYNRVICLYFSLLWGAFSWLILLADIGMERLLRDTPFSYRRIFPKKKKVASRLT